MEHIPNFKYYRARTTCGKVGFAWTSDEEDNLACELHEGIAIDVVAREHSRTPCGILTRAVIICKRGTRTAQYLNIADAPLWIREQGRVARTLKRDGLVD